MRCIWLLVAFSLFAFAEDKPTLSLVDVAVHDYEDSAPVAASYPFHSGEMVYLSFRIAGYQIKETEDTSHIQLSYEIEARDGAGRPLSAAKAGKIDAELEPEDKKWLPKVRYSVQLPSVADAGTYIMRIAVRDEVAGTTATRDVPIKVESRKVEASDSLAVREFRFLRSDKDSDVVIPGSSFRAGDTVWARFDLTGYKFGEKNRYQIRYGVALVDANGKVLFHKPDAASDSEESYYPKRYVTGTLNLKLDKTIRPGEYTLVLTASDEVGKQSIEERHTFPVEK
jgi:hypothetical protein